MTNLELQKSVAEYIPDLATDLKIHAKQVENTIELLMNGATLPFIARYRKEKTGSLNEEVLYNLNEKWIYFTELEERKQSILKQLLSQDVLTDELKQKIKETRSKIQLEDIYLPYKPKRKTRATTALEAGLGLLAEALASGANLNEPPEVLTKDFINPEKGIKTATEAIKGAMNILAEKVAEEIDGKNAIREKEGASSLLFSKAKDKEKKSKFETYYDFKELVGKMPSHRILAIRRGEKEGILKTSIEMSDEENIAYLAKKHIPKDSGLYTDAFNEMIKDSYQRLLKPAIETEIRNNLKTKADQEAFKVFRRNLKDVLMAPPAVGKVVMGVDPGFKSGTKLAVVDATGKFLQEKTIYPVPPQNEAEASKTILLAMIESFKVEVIAIGNGTASREVDEFISKAMEELEKPVIKMLVSEAGASVYSASTIARKEFPKLDVTIRGAISIARRVQDPLAELVKIEPKSIGVGQYQHDVNQSELKEKLEYVVQHCVNAVGVNVNTASEALLGYVSGINRSLAKNIVQFREKNGPFKMRATLVKTPQFGPKAFEQAAGFLRILDSENPLDGTSVHPERYELVQKICEEEKKELKSLINNQEALSQIQLEKFVTNEVGLPTLEDIKRELEKPNRDPRKKFVYAQFNPNIKTISDLKEGLWLEGVVTNVTDFGVFVDIGVHQDGMIHVSELIKKPFGDGGASTGDIVKVRVISANPEQKRISLSMREASASGSKTGRSKLKSRPKKKKHATLNQLKSKFSQKDDSKKNNVKLKFSLKSIMKSGR